MLTEFARKLRKAARILLTFDPLLIRALGKGVAVSVEHFAVLRQLPGIRSVTDIGANRGQFALAARHCFAGAPVYSFEPLPGPAERHASLLTSSQGFHLFRAAIGPEKKQAVIHLSASDDSSSLLPIAELQSTLFPGTAEAGILTIEMCTLSDCLAAEMILQPALLKIDVQGFELPALRGCELLLACYAWVYVECSFVELYLGQSLANQVIDWLHARGFLLAGVFNMAYDGKGGAIQADFLFARAPG